MSNQGRIILAGGGGFCRELYFWVADCHAAGRLPPIGGYLDDAGPSLARLSYDDMPWLGSIDSYDPKPGDGVLLAVGTPKTKRAIHGKLSVRGAQFPQLIHPDTRVVRTAQLGEGVIMCPQTAANPDVIIERFVTFNASSGAGHDAHIGEFTMISSLVDILGYTKIGRDVMIGDSATILPKVKVGDGSTIGAGSLVYRSVPAGATTYGAPSKMMRLSTRREAGKTP
jgi:sugar O-acyltransferase (sialic acid O-acetyltransferase NeuD family)